MKSMAFMILTVYLCVVSLIAVFVTITDKIKAKHGKWRIPESTLLMISALGGSVAMYLTMHTIRHKTKHIKFMAGIPLIMVFQAVILWWLFTCSGLF